MSCPRSIFVPAIDVSFCNCCRQCQAVGRTRTRLNSCTWVTLLFHTISHHDSKHSLSAQHTRNVYTMICLDLLVRSRVPLFARRAIDLCHFQTFEYGSADPRQILRSVKEL